MAEMKKSKSLVKNDGSIEHGGYGCGDGCGYYSGDGRGDGHGNGGTIYRNGNGSGTGYGIGHKLLTEVVSIKKGEISPSLLKN